MPVDYQTAYSRIGQTLGQGLSNVGQSFSDIGAARDADVNREREQEAYDLVQKKLENFDDLKIELSDEIAVKMQGQPDKEIQRVKSYIKNIQDPKQLIAMSIEYNQQLEEFEQNKGVYKTPPQFGMQAKTYTEQNKRFLQKAEQKTTGEAVQKGLTGTPAQPGTPTQFEPGFEAALETSVSEQIAEKTFEGAGSAIQEPARGPLPAVPPATTQEGLTQIVPPETAGSKEGQAAIKGAGLPTERQAGKTEMEKDKFEFEQDKFEYRKAKDEAERGDRTVDDRAAWARLELSRKKYKQSLRTEEVDISSKYKKAKTEYEELTTLGFVTREASANLPEKREPAPPEMVREAQDHIGKLKEAMEQNKKELREMDKPIEDITGGKKIGDYSIIKPPPPQMPFSADTLAKGAKLRAQNVPEPDVQAFMKRLQGQTQ